MHKFWLRLKAPFAAFRYFAAGTYRSVSPVIPYSAAWGLVHNLCGVDIRANTDQLITTIDPDAPPLMLAIGAIRYGDTSILTQQLHSYPVGDSGKENADRARGSKYWIAPVKREVLSGFDMMLGVGSPDKGLSARVRAGLRGELKGARYGLPFAGDNNLLFESIAILDEPVEASWYTPVYGVEGGVRAGSCQLSIKIDRTNNARSRSALFAPCAKSILPPDDAWVWTPQNPPGIIDGLLASRL